MARFYTIQIDTIYLTSTGGAGGTPCKLDVTGWDDLLTTVAGNVRPNADGSPDFQLFPWTSGKQFDVKIEVLNQSEWDDLRDLQIDSLENETEFTVIGTGDTGDFSVTARAFPDKPFTAARFHNGLIFGAIFRFITT